jgi:hypothetical protein
MRLDQVGAVDLAQVGAGSALVDAEQGVERFEGAAMDVEGIGQEFADRRQAWSMAAASPAWKSRASARRRALA